MDSCCAVKTVASRCPRCGEPGRSVEAITVKAMLRPEALERRSALDHRFCMTRDCPVVYFGKDEIFEREEIAVAVFEKEPVGDRTVCYCFGIREGDIRREFRETGGSTAAERVRTLIKAGRCACEVKNPAGSCCLGNVVAAAKAVEAAKSAEARTAGSLLEAEAH